MAIAALVLGILGIIGGWIPIVQYFTFFCAVLGIVFGVKERNRAQTAGEPTGMATAGMVLGIIGVACSAIGTVCILCLGAAALTL